MYVWIQCTDVGYLALLYSTREGLEVRRLLYNELLSRLLMCTIMLNGRERGPAGCVGRGGHLKAAGMKNINNSNIK
jgi:hypothetical protein